MNFITNKVKESEITNIIMDYKNDLDLTEKFKPVLKELKEYNKYIKSEHNDFSYNTHIYKRGDKYVTYNYSDNIELNNIEFDINNKFLYFEKYDNKWGLYDFCEIMDK
jgi:hypothetical protein